MTEHKQRIDRMTRTDFDAMEPEDLLREFVRCTCAAEEWSVSDAIGRRADAIADVIIAKMKMGIDAKHEAEAMERTE